MLDTVGLVLVNKNFGATRLAVYGPALHIPCSLQCTYCATCLLPSVPCWVHNTVVVCMDYVVWQVIHACNRYVTFAYSTTTNRQVATVLFYRIPWSWLEPGEVKGGVCALHIHSSNLPSSGTYKFSPVWWCWWWPLLEGVSSPHWGGLGGMLSSELFLHPVSEGELSTHAYWPSIILILCISQYICLLTGHKSAFVPIFFLARVHEHQQSLPLPQKWCTKDGYS